jgi:transposase
VARCLEALGHEVIVADPNFAPMYATRSRKVKTDRRDARSLAEACVLGAYRAAHRLSDAQRHVQGRVGVRDALVRTSTRYIVLIRALIRQQSTSYINALHPRSPTALRPSPCRPPPTSARGIPAGAVGTAPPEGYPTQAKETSRG